MFFVFLLISFNFTSQTLIYVPMFFCLLFFLVNTFNLSHYLFGVNKTICCFGHIL